MCCKLDLNSNVDVSSIHVGYMNNRQAFSTTAECHQEKYLLPVSNIYFGSSPKEIRMLTCEIRESNKLNMPQ